MEINLPSWPAVRIVREACDTWNLRHDANRQLDPETSDWSELYTCALCFLRHCLSPYDQTLHERDGDDVAYRNLLVHDVAAVAHRKYTWLRRDIDPRPFPKTEKEGLFFDYVAKSLAQLHTQRDQIVLRLSAGKRQPGNRAGEIARLKESLAEIDDQIAGQFRFFSKPPAPEGTGYCLIGAHPKEVQGRYYFGGRRLSPNHFEYLHFRCPACLMAVVQSKRPVAYGQGRKMICASCGCLSIALEPPWPGYALAPITVENWAAELAETFGV